MDVSDGTMKGVELFKVGKWTDSLGRPVNADNKFIDEIVTNFNSLNTVPGFNVPIKLGHNDNVGEPAFGWVSDVRNESGVLTADFADMDPAIVDLISKRRYNTVSIELAPTVKYEGKTFQNVLSGVALLGAEWPAVKGLKPLSASKFAESGETIRLGQEEVTTETAKFTQTEANALVLAAETRVTKDYATQLTAETAKVTAAEQRAVIAETAIATFRDASDKKEVDGIIELAATAGKLTPANKEKALKFGERILKNTSGDERKSAISEFKELVAAMAPAIKFGELGRSKQTDDAAAASKASDEIAAEANNLLGADTTGKLDFAGAVRKVLATNDDLRQRYAAQ